jgi:hypothetical protein
MAPFGTSKAAGLDFYADPDPAFHSNADPGLALQMQIMWILIRIPQPCISLTFFSS